MQCIWRDWKSIVYYELLLQNMRLNSNKYFSQISQLKSIIEEKRPELADRKCRLRSGKRLTSPMSEDSAQICTAWLELYYDAYYTFLTLNCRIATYFKPYKIFFNSLEDYKNHLYQFSTEIDVRRMES